MWSGKPGCPGIGYSSPVIWKDKLFTVTALAETQEKVLLCYDCKNGELIWQKTVLKALSRINMIITVMLPVHLQLTATMSMSLSWMGRMLSLQLTTFPENRSGFSGPEHFSVLMATAVRLYFLRTK